MSRERHPADTDAVLRFLITEASSPLWFEEATMTLLDVACEIADMDLFQFGLSLDPTLLTTPVTNQASASPSPDPDPVWRRLQSLSRTVAQHLSARHLPLVSLLEQAARAAAIGAERCGLSGHALASEVLQSPWGLPAFARVQLHLDPTADGSA